MKWLENQHPEICFSPQFGLVTAKRRRTDCCDNLIRLIISQKVSFYDSFGMTAIEASAFGAPSMINCRDVGATELLKKDGFMAVDFAKSFNALAMDVETILSDTKQISAVREESYRRAMSWDEDASGKTILSRLKALI